MTAKIKKLKAFDPAEYLDDPKAISAYLEEAFDTSDAKFIADAMGVVARASGMRLGGPPMLNPRSRHDFVTYGCAPALL